MMTNFREMIGMSKLVDACGVAKESRDARQKKAIKNIKYCANDQWQFVNSWYDEKSESARQYMLDAQEIFDTIYRESQENIYSEGMVMFGSHCESFLKDIRFCGKKFLQSVCLYYTAKLLEDSIYEVEGTEEDATRILEELQVIKNSIN